MNETTSLFTSIQLYFLFLYDHALIFFDKLLNWNKIISEDIFKGFNFVISSKGPRRNAFFFFVTTFITNSSCNNLISHSNSFLPKTMFQSSFKFSTNVRGGCRDFPYSSCPCACPASPTEYQCRFINGNKCTTLMRDVDNSCLFFISTDTFVILNLQMKNTENLGNLLPATL